MEISTKVRIHPNYLNYKMLNAATSSLGPLRAPLVDEVFDSLGKGCMFSLVNLVFPFHQTIIDTDTAPLTIFCTPTRLF